MKDFAIAISVYDKFQDVRLLCDLLRKNWPGDYHIAVCSSHPGAASALADCDIDELLSTADMPVGDGGARDPRVSPRARLWVKVIDSIRTVCGHCAVRSEAPYTLHIHADACPLSWPKLAQLAETMKRHGKRFAARGEGFGFYTVNEPLGGFDDMFFVVDNAFAREARLWDFDPFDFLPHKISIHGVLAILGLTRVGIRRFYHYGSHTQAVYWDGKPVVLHPLNSAHPMYFDPENDFLHIHESGFPGDLGVRLKAYYLVRFGITRGQHVEEFLGKWEMPERELFDELAESEARLRSFFLSRGISPAGYGRNFDDMTALKDGFERLPLPGKGRWLWRMHLQQAKGTVATLARRRLMRGRVHRDRYPDTIWPARLDALYDAAFSGVPRERRDFSFDS
jgi:hypothetical protein